MCSLVFPQVRTIVASVVTLITFQWKVFLFHMSKHVLLKMPSCFKPFLTFFYTKTDDRSELACNEFATSIWLENVMGIFCIDKLDLLW